MVDYHLLFFAGLEQFSVDLAYRVPELLNLLELMNGQFIEKIRCVKQTCAMQLKLWENLDIDTMGPAVYREHLAPVYRKMLDVLSDSDMKVMVHYDGHLKLIAEDINKLAFDGLDSLTPPPEGNLTIAEARSLRPEKFLWIHPTLSWFQMQEKDLIEKD